MGSLPVVHARSDTVHLLRCDDADREAWDDYVSATDRASFYHRYAWREINRESLGHESCYLAAIDAGRVVGILPFVHVDSRLFGNIACSMPFVNYGGPVGDSEEVETQLVTEATRVADEWGVEFLEIRARRHLGDTYPTSLHKVSMTVDLPADPDEMWKGFKTELRQHIRRGYKRGFSVVAGGVELVDDFFSVFAEAWRDMGTPVYSKEYLQRVARVFSGRIRICIAYHDSTPAAGSFQAYDGGIAEGLWLGTRAKYRHDYVGYVLYWELLKDAIAGGCRHFHLGRSTAQSGAEQFKKKWNAYPTQLYWQYVLRTRESIPQLNVMNPKFRLAIATWRRLPLFITNTIGPSLARNIP
ncbi:MAG TPA: FemAB family XrtA/PEP-CTERM system-associated protein [Vicinamibacterales bacterium]|nr:FemAB family XrtA/PEP-CTERM system-associated protein [Vicinamibacterales bacterium]